MGLLTTTIGAYPKPDYIELPDWFGNLDTSHPTRGWAAAVFAMGESKLYPKRSCISVFNGSTKKYHLQ